MNFNNDEWAKRLTQQRIYPRENAFSPMLINLPPPYSANSRLATEPSTVSFTWARSTMDTRCRAPCCRYVFLQRQLHHVVTALLAQRDLFDGKRVKSSEISIEIFGSFFEDFMFLLHYNVWVLYIYFILFYFISDFILYIYFFLLV